MHNFIVASRLVAIAILVACTTQADAPAVDSSAVAQGAPAFVSGGDTALTSESSAIASEDSTAIVATAGPEGPSTTLVPDPVVLESPFDPPTTDGGNMVTAGEAGSESVVGEIALSTPIAMTFPVDVCTNTHKQGDEGPAATSDTMRGTYGAMVKPGTEIILKLAATNLN